MMDDSTLNQAFVLHKAHGTTWVFRPSNNGLCISDVKKDVSSVSINTVDDNKTKYTVKGYSNAVHAFSLQEIIGQLATNDFI